MTDQSAEVLARIAQFETHLAVHAGAGTGKTHALTTLYLHLVAGVTSLRRRIPPERILVVTFTDKAKKEMQARISSRMSELAHAAPDRAEGEAMLTQLAGELEIGLPGQDHWAASEIALERAPIGTFHSLAAQLLKRHGALIGIDPDFVLLDENQSSEEAIAAAEQAVLQALDEQDHAAGTLVAELGFRGVGRGRGLCEELVALATRLGEETSGDETSRAESLLRGYHPEELARDWALARGRWYAVLSAPATKRNQPSSELDPALRVLPVAESFADVDVKALCAMRARVTTRVLKQALDDLVAVTLSKKSAPLAEGLLRLCNRFSKLYRARKQSAGALDFSDLLLELHRLLGDPQRAAFIRQHYDAILVDEFQDTNRLQAELIDRLAGPFDSGLRRFVVGDRKQSIYEFRGADVGVFTRVSRSLLAHDGKEEFLRVSRRSAPALLAFTNLLFAEVMRSDEDAPDWENHFVVGHDDLLPWRAEAEGACELITIAGEDSDQTRRDEAAAIAARIGELQRQSTPLSAMALLLRGFTHLEVYLEALRAADVAHSVVGGRGLFLASEVRDLATALRLYERGDRFALVSLLRSPFVLLSDESLARLQLADELADVLGRVSWSSKLGAEERERLTRFQRLWRSLKASRGLDAATFVHTLLVQSGYLAVVSAGREGAQKVANLELLLERALEAPSLATFSRWLRDSVEEERDGPPASVVEPGDNLLQVMTVHQAKGLEFDVVFVADCGATPPIERAPILYDADAGLGLRLQHGDRAHKRRSDSVAQKISRLRVQKRQAESLRLFYVATTRARNRLILSGEAQRKGDSWRSHIDALRASHAGAQLLGVIDGQRLVASKLGNEWPAAEEASPI